VGLLGREDARVRVGSCIPLLARGQAAGALVGGAVSRIPVTRSGMGEFLGRTTETVSRQVTELTRDGLLQARSSRELVIPSISALTQAAEDSAN